MQNPDPTHTPFSSPWAGGPQGVVPPLDAPTSEARALIPSPSWLPLPELLSVAKIPMGFPAKLHSPLPGPRHSATFAFLLGTGSNSAPTRACLSEPLNCSLALDPGNPALPPLRSSVVHGEECTTGPGWAAQWLERYPCGPSLWLDPPRSGNKQKSTKLILK